MNRISNMWIIELKDSSLQQAEIELSTHGFKAEIRSSIYLT